MIRFGIYGVDFVFHAPRRHVHFAADNGLDALLFARFVKIDRPEQHAVIRDRAGGLPQGLYRGGQLGNLTFAVEQTVFGMDVQMYEIGHNVPFLYNKNEKNTGSNGRAGGENGCT